MPIPQAITVQIRALGYEIKVEHPAISIAA
jgi:hypothetical protein